MALVFTSYKLLHYYILHPKGFIRTAMKFLTHEILQLAFFFFLVCLIKALKVGISMQYSEPVPLGKPVLFLWRVSSFIELIFLCF